MHMPHSVNMSLCISNVCIPVLRSETEPLVLQFTYVFHDHDMRYLYCGVDMCFIYHFYVLLLLKLLILHHDWYFVFISYYGQLHLLFFFNISSAPFLFLLFSR